MLDYGMPYGRIELPIRVLHDSHPSNWYTSKRLLLIEFEIPNLLIGIENKLRKQKSVKIRLTNSKVLDEKLQNAYLNNFASQNRI